MIIKAVPAVNILSTAQISPELLREPRPQPLIAGAARLPAVRSEADRKLYEAGYLSIPNGKVVVTEREIFYLTEDDRFFPEYYPQPWIYRARVDADGALSIPIDALPLYRREGAAFAPFLVAGNWFHVLADNLARMYYFARLGMNDVAVLLPSWGDGPANSDRAFVNRAFLHGKLVHVLAPGVYHYDAVIVPPLANTDDYMVSAAIRFVAETLRRLAAHKPHTHRLRLFVSRADIGVRNLSNESALIEALRPLGVTPICPGDFSFRTQLEIFAAADLIMGVHGQGFTPMLAARGCRLVMEFEATGWPFTAYSSIACALDIGYERAPCRLIAKRNPKRFDWVAEADVARCVERVAAAIEGG